jgi:hypothetical protein
VTLRDRRDWDLEQSSWSERGVEKYLVDLLKVVIEHIT